VAGDLTVHKTPSDDPYRCLVLNFNTNSQQIRHIPRVSQWVNDDILDGFVNEMLKYFHDDSYDNDILGPYAYATVFWQAYRSIQRKNDSDMPQTLQKLLDYINRNLENELAVKDLAELAGISEPHLYAQFKKYLKLSPHQYIMRRRLLKAKRLLVSSPSGIKEISFECGFANIECFYRAFKKQCGLSPGSYRSRYMPYQ
jgi:AraC-like DNA-binding protein